MSIISKVTAYGTPGVIAAGAAAIWGQTALQWVTQPSHMLPVAAITAVSALTIAKRKGKVKDEAPTVEAPTAEQAQRYLDSLRSQALPPAQSTQQHRTWDDKRMVIDHQGQTVERFRSA